MTSTNKTDKQRWRRDRWSRALISLGGISVLITLVGLIAYLIWMITPLFFSRDISFLSFFQPNNLPSPPYGQPAEAQYMWQSTGAKAQEKLSLVPMLFGTFKAALVAMVFAIPLAVGAAIYTGYFMTPTLRRVIKPSIEMIEALPTVIIGFIAALWLAPWLDKHLFSAILFVLCLPLSLIGLATIYPQFFAHRVNFAHRINSDLQRKLRGMAVVLILPFIILLACLLLLVSPWLEQLIFQGDIRYWFSAHGWDFTQRNSIIIGVAMGFAVIPTIFTLSEEAIFSVPRHLSHGASALGATRWQCFTSIVWATALPGIIAAVMMGMSRAIGETMIVLMATGNTPIMDWNLLEGMRTLTANIAIEMPESEGGSVHFRLLFLSAFILLICTFIFNSIVEWIRQRLRVKYAEL